MNQSKTDAWTGYTLRISGGNDKQGFPMLQGVLSNQRVRLLMNKNSKCFRERRAGQRKKKSVRGCIIDTNQMAVINVVITKEGMCAYMCICCGLCFDMCMCCVMFV